MGDSRDYGNSCSQHVAGDNSEMMLFLGIISIWDGDTELQKDEFNCLMMFHDAVREAVDW